MALKYTYNPDGSIKSVVSDTMGRVQAPMALPDYMYANNQAPTPSANAVMGALLGNKMEDPFTGSLNPRTFDDFKKFISTNKNNFTRDFGKKEGLKRFNQVLNQVQEGIFDQLSPEEAKFVDDVKNNKINL
tara:strand:+ start:148 stop:540 length:393 start_codon:yes stop_codon:yes gene_type:complete